MSIVTALKQRRVDILQAIEGIAKGLLLTAIKHSMSVYDLDEAYEAAA